MVQSMSLTINATPWRCMCCIVMATIKLSKKPDNMKMVWLYWLFSMMLRFVCLFCCNINTHAFYVNVKFLIPTLQATQLNGFKGLENIIASLTAIKDLNQSAQVTNFTLNELFGNMTTSEFYTYQGSLTTPPCSQAVQWIVFPQVINISHAQMQQFRSLSDNHGEILENNYRHLQPKGTRLVFFRQKSNVLDDIFNSPNIWSVLDKLKPEPFQNVAN